jgi:hypothetical protein
MNFGQHKSVEQNLGIHFVIKTDKEDVALADGRCSEVAGTAKDFLCDGFTVFVIRAEFEDFFAAGNKNFIRIFDKIPARFTFDGLFFGIDFNFQSTFVINKSLTGFFTGDSTLTHISPFKFHKISCVVKVK